MGWIRRNRSESPSHEILLWKGYHVYQLSYNSERHAAKLYGEAHVEWNLNGFLTNKIPLLKNAGWNLVAGNNTLYLNQSNYYTEAFVGIDNLGYKLLRFRLDVVRGWDHTGQVRTGLRFGFDGGLLAGLAGISIGDDKEKFNW